MSHLAWILHQGSDLKKGGSKGHLPITVVKVVFSSKTIPWCPYENPGINEMDIPYLLACRRLRLKWVFHSCTMHLFSQNYATNTEHSAQSRSEHIFMELTLFVNSINSQYFCIKSGLNYLRYKRYNRNETEGHIFFCNLNFHRNGIYILYINCYHHRKIYILH